MVDVASFLKLRTCHDGGENACTNVVKNSNTPQNFNFVFNLDSSVDIRLVTRTTLNGLIESGDVSACEKKDVL